MDYNVPELMDRVKQLEKRVLQLEVSSTQNMFRAVSSAQDIGRALDADVEDVWQEFDVDPVSVTVETGTSALVIIGGRPLLLPAFSKYRTIDIGYRVTHTVTGATIEPDDAYLATRVVHVNLQTLGGSGSDAMWGSSTTQIILQEGLTPGENTFLMLGRYDEVTAYATPPTVANRNLTVIPLDV